MDYKELLQDYLDDANWHLNALTLHSFAPKRKGTTEQTSVVFGMPRVAINSGVVDKVVPLTDMAKEILRNV